MRLSKPKGADTPAKPTAASTATSKPKTASTGVTLPTSKFVPTADIGKMSILLYGEKKIGKTSFASQFPDALILAFEKGYTGLSVFVEPMFNDKEIPDWKKFVAYIDELVKGEHPFKTVIVDTADVAYAACMSQVCINEGWDHPSEGAFGKGWKAVETEFSRQIGRLVNSEHFGVIFVSHAVEKEFLERTGGKYDKIISSMPEQARKLVSAVCDCIVFYGYHGDDRLITIRGSDSLEAGTRMRSNFWIKDGRQVHESLSAKKRELVEAGKGKSKEVLELDKQMGELRIHSIPAGMDEEEAYFNFKRAFNNQQETNGKPDFEYGSIEKKAPMTKK